MHLVARCIPRGRRTSSCMGADQVVEVDLETMSISRTFDLDVKRPVFFSASMMARCMSRGQSAPIRTPARTTQQHTGIHGDERPSAPWLASSGMAKAQCGTVRTKRPSSSRSVPGSTSLRAGSGFHCQRSPVRIDLRRCVCQPERRAAELTAASTWICCWVASKAPKTD